MSRWAERLYLFVKPARIGRAKTRLAKEIGAGAAATFYRNSVEGLFARLGDDPRWETLAAVDGPADVPLHGVRGAEQVTQGGGDLGDRLRRIAKTAPPGPIVVLGSDAPQIASGHIVQAFHALKSADLVLGPSGDGGYWLVGLKRVRGMGALFRYVRWSTEHALADTRASAPNYFRTAYLERLDDVDDAASLRAVRPLRSRPAPARMIAL